MPELPEVETVRRGLAPVVTGRRIAAVELRRPDLRFPFPERFAERLVGQRIDRLERRAKYLIAELSGGEDLVMHLGMTGRFTILEKGRTDTPGEYVNSVGAAPVHDHVVFTLTGGARIVYNDPRRFGFMVMMPHAERSDHPLFRGLGVEPLGSELTADYLAARARGKKANLKAFLMDQRIVVGVGNIYVAEALFAAGVRPMRAAGKVTRRDYALIVDAIRRILAYAIERGGTTLRDFLKPDGEPGYFEQELFVYGRDGEPCKRCGTAITARRDAQRASFYCRVCQR